VERREGLEGEGVKAWLVTGPLGRGLSFALDFAAAARTMLLARRQS
jgi:hypothetical protein